MVEKIFIQADQELPWRQAVGCISNWQCPRFWSQGERWDGGYGEVALRLVCSGTCLLLLCFFFCFFYFAQQIRSQTQDFWWLYFHPKTTVQQPLLSIQKSHELLVKCSWAYKDYEEVQIIQVFTTCDYSGVGRVVAWLWLLGTLHFHYCNFKLF